METLRDSWPHEGRRAVKPLKVIIIGSGIGGLCAGLALAQTGHAVTIFESAQRLAEVGAGIQLAPNASRILHRLGILDEVMGRASDLSAISTRRYSCDDEISSTPMMPECGKKYGAPMSVIHRADLQSIIFKAAKNHGCRIYTHHTVLAVEPSFSARVRVHNHETGEQSWYSGSMVVAADGTKSTIRRQMASANQWNDEPLQTTDAAYRLLIPRAKVQNDPELLAMLAQNVGMRYMGPGGHIMAYPLRDNSVYNLVLIHPAKRASAAKDSWTSKGDRQEMLDFYKDWSPAIRKWLELADHDILEWTLYQHPKLPAWVQGSVALVGDACHPMLPYVAQGAANAIEDAAVLATALTCTSDVDVALGLYERVRKQRAEMIAASASSTAETLHLPDGPEQRARDEAMADSGSRGRQKDQWIDEKWQDFVWGVDVMRETIDCWDAMGV